MVDGGKQHEFVRLAIFGQQFCAHIFVDYCGHALIGSLVPIVSNDGNAATAGADDDELVVEKVEDALSLYDFPRDGARDNAAEASP